MSVGYNNSRPVGLIGYLKSVGYKGIKTGQL